MIYKALNFQSNSVVSGYAKAVLTSLITQFPTTDKLSAAYCSLTYPRPLTPQPNISASLLV